MTVREEVAPDETLEAELDDVELEPEETAEDETPPADDEGELVVTIGDEAPEPDETQGAPQWVKDLRKENRELKKKLKAAPAVPAGTPKVGEKPTLAGCEYDSEEFEKQLEAWHEAKREAEKAEREAKESQTAQQREWEQRVNSHTKAKGALGVKDYDEAEEAVFDQLDQTQQGIIISGAENSALLVYALAKAPKKLKELSTIKDPVKYAFAIAKLETQLKTNKRRPATPPEGSVERSNAGKALTGQAGLEKLRAEAERTGDYSKVHAYKTKLRAR